MYNLNPTVIIPLHRQPHPNLTIWKHFWSNSHLCIPKTQSNAPLDLLTFANIFQICFKYEICFSTKVQQPYLQRFNANMAVTTFTA